MAREFFSSPRFVVFVVTCAAFTDVFLCDLIVAALPNLIRDRAKVPEKDVAVWMSALMSSFGVGQMLALPVVGWFTDRSKNRKTPFTCGLVTLCFATFGFFLATTAPVMLTARFMQGCSAAFIMSSGMTFVTEAVPKDQAANAVGWVSSAQAVGEIAGIVSGGVLYDLGGHTAMFVTAVSLVIIDIALRLLVRSPSSEKNMMESDPEIQEQTEASPLLPGQEHRTPADLRPAVVELLLHKDVLLTLFAIFCTGFLRQALETNLPYMLQGRYGWTPSIASAALLGFMAPSIFSPLQSAAMVRWGPRKVGPLGFAVVTAALVGGSFMSGPEVGFRVGMCIDIVILGASTSLLFTGMITASTRIAEWTRQSPLFAPTGAPGQVFSLLTLSACAGASLGPLWLALLEKKTNWSITYLTLAAIAAVAGVTMSFSWKKWP